MDKEERKAKEQVFLRREEDIRKLQEKFNELILNVVKEPVTGKDLPDIVENIDRKEPVGMAARQKKISLIIKGSIGIGLFLFIAFTPFFLKLKGIGAVVPEKRRLLIAPFSGEIETFKFKYGDFVKKKEVIVSLNTNSKELELRYKKNLLAIIDEQLKRMLSYEDNYRKILENKKELAEKNIISTTEVESYQIELDKLRIDYMNIMKEKAKLEEQIILLEEQINKSELFSPIDGVIMTPDLEKINKQFIKQGTVICEIADFNSFIIQLDIPEDDIIKIKKGQIAKVKFSLYPKKIFKGTVTKLSSYINESFLSGKKIHSESPNIQIALNAKVIKSLTINIKMDDMPKDVLYGTIAKVTIYCKKVRLVDYIKDLF